MSAESTSVEGASPAPRRLGRYTLGTRVGEGGMGVVYRARPDGAPSDGSGDVAMKVLRPHIAHDPDARLRLAREVTTLSRVSSPRIAAVLDADTEGPAPYIVTEFVPGPPLDQVVADRGPVSGEALVRLGRGLSEALNAIHRAGIVHRDLKPGNVLMVGSDPVVIDFGIAQVADDVRLTMTGLVMGTPGYLSPEVVEGGAVTEATDWWGWAATLAFAASGQPPFGRGPMAVVLDRVIRGRTQLEEVDPALRPLLAAALDPEPDRRPHSDEVMRALELYAAHRPVTEALTMHAPRPRTEQAAPQTSLTPQAQQTRVQPVPPTPQTRVAPQQVPLTAPALSPDAASGPAPYGAPQAPYGGPGQDPYANPSPYDTPDRFGQPMRRPDPRIGRPMRSGTLATALVAVVGLAALVPLLAWGLLAIWSVLARTVDHSVTSLVLRRHEAGRRRSDVPLAVIASPWHLFVAVLSTGLAMLLPIAFALAATVITAGGLTAMGVASLGVEHPVPVAVGTALGTLMAWWGPGGLALRRGSRTLVRAVLPSQIASQIVATLLLVGGVALLAWMVLDGGEVSWWPTTWTDAPFSDLIPQTLRP
ncbi:serine/threonine protein kinase [Ornithinimicrobium cryptoxanthini]|uniref:Protein kinase n=1 Tax=Ornithinimicrobium cryptoxanthini TaxID=2934161 RepID=A0ABY4YL68_9MICO|nr:serine/threonine protein kinase [Ornithinimicrobium cryptoxanthini]USQ76887.1 protein kinase [Ornithinimicrobium cryptoxanthini]